VSELARVAWRRRGAWDGILVPGRSGAQDGPPGVTVTPLEQYGVASIIVRHDSGRALHDYFTSTHGVTPPSTAAVASGRDCALVWAGPDQWLAVSSDRSWPAKLAKELGGIAAVSDQSDGRALLHVRGARMRDALAKGCPIDLHPRSFAAGGAAVTLVAQVGVHLWQLSTVDGLHLAVFRSMAASFGSWLHASAAEFGVEVAPPNQSYV
jgi:methylglutamate dehydrogenase subunit D